MSLHPVLRRGVLAALIARSKAVEVVAGRKSVVRAAAGGALSSGGGPLVRGAR